MIDFQNVSFNGLSSSWSSSATATAPRRPSSLSLPPAASSLQHHHQTSTNKHRTCSSSSSSSSATAADEIDNRNYSDLVLHKFSHVQNEDIDDDEEEESSASSSKLPLSKSDSSDSGFESSPDTSPTDTPIKRVNLTHENLFFEEEFRFNFDLIREFSGPIFLKSPVKDMRKVIDWRKRLQSAWSTIRNDIDTVAGTDESRKKIAKIRAKFHSIELYPTESQVYEMIQCANKCANRQIQQTVAGPSHQGLEDSIRPMTFGEFCFLASILIANANLPPPRPIIPNSFMYQRMEMLVTGTTEQKNCGYDVFLGGSCNPTRWRKEVVMPKFKENNITFYNPQVDDWFPELIEIENHAKQTSELLFFVIDNQTRAIASMIEVAFIAASNRKLILVINDLEPWSSKFKIGNDHVSKAEYDTLRRGRHYLRDIVERQGIPIFSDLNSAMEASIEVLKNCKRPQDLMANPYVIPVKNGHITVGDKMMKLYYIFQSLRTENNDLNLIDIPFAYRTLTSRELSETILLDIAKCHWQRKYKIINNNDKQPLPTFPSSIKEIKINFDEFCIIISELNILFSGNSSSSSSSGGRSSSGGGGGNSSSGSSEPEQQPPSQQQQQQPQQEKSKTQRLWEKFNDSVQTFRNFVTIQLGDENTLQQQERPTITQPEEGNQIKTNTVEKDTTRKKKISSKISFSTKRGSRSRDGQQPFPAPLSSTPMRSSQSMSQLPAVDPGLTPLQPSNNHRYSRFRASLSPYTSKKKTDTSRFRARDQRQSFSYSTPLRFRQQRSRSPYHRMSASITSLIYDTNYLLYLGGQFDENMLTDIIKPELKKHSITFVTQKFDKLANQERMLPLEAKNIERCKVLLFVIPDNSFDISFMIIASHYVGLGYQTVLCIQNIRPGSIPELTEAAVKDYNRGRSYLSDMATKSGVPVFENIKEAINRCIQMLYTNTPIPKPDMIV